MSNFTTASFPAGSDFRVGWKNVGKGMTTPMKSSVFSTYEGAKHFASRIAASSNARIMFRKPGNTNFATVPHQGKASGVTTLKLSDLEVRALLFAIWSAENAENDAPESHNEMYQGLVQLAKKLAKEGWE